MANKNILTTLAKTVQVEHVYLSPTSVIPPDINVRYGTTYAFISKVEPWVDDNNPPTPSGDVSYLKQTFKNMIAAKLVHTSDISPVIQRIDWESGFVYDYYQDNVEMTEKDDQGNNVYYFYVKNKYDQVFKCLWNNSGGPS